MPKINHEISDPIVASVAEKIIGRSEVGIKKYRQQLTRDDISATGWLEHLQEELLDGANYAEALIYRINEIKALVESHPMTDFEMVQEFIEKFDADHPSYLWMMLVIEEFKETMAAFGLPCEVVIDKSTPENYSMNKVEVLDGICDLKYVLNGLGHSFRWNVDEAFKEVHKSNMTKLGEDGKPIKREDGKIMKGPNFKLPNLKRFIEAGDKERFGDITPFSQ